MELKIPKKLHEYKKRDEGMEALVSAVEKRRALFSVGGNLIGNSYQNKAVWKSIATELNSKHVYKHFVSANDAKGKWSDLKYRLSKKLEKMKKEAGGRVVSLSSFDQRVLKLLEFNEKNDTNHDSNPSYQDDRNSSASLSQKTSNIKGKQPTFCSFSLKKKLQASNVERLLILEEKKLYLKAEKIKQTKKIADYLTTLVDLKKKEHNLNSKKS